MDDLQKRAVEADDLGDLPAAFELWKECAKSDIDGTSSLKYGRVALELEKWEESEEAFHQALHFLPEFYLVKALMGGLWLKRTDKDETESLQTAKEWFLKALENKKMAPTLTLLGAVCARLDDAAAAKEAFEEAIQLDPNNDEAMYNLAAIEEKTSPSKARDLLERTIQIDPDYALAHQMLGRVYTKLKDLDRAEYHYRQCLQIDPAEYQCNIFLAGLLVALKRNAEAEQIYRHAIELCPEMAVGFEFYARFLEKNGRVAEAIEQRAKIKPSEWAVTRSVP
jgi:tetratricopeptide (TPR) repeat protein